MTPLNSSAKPMQTQPVRRSSLPRKRATPRTHRCPGCSARISSSVCPDCKTRKATTRTSIGKRCDKKAAELCKRLAGFRCSYCLKPGVPNASGLPIGGLDWSHRVKRKSRGDRLRWSMDNCDSLCRRCHDYLGSHLSKYIGWVNNMAGRDIWAELEARADLPWDRDYGRVIAELTAALKAAKDAGERIVGSGAID